MNLFSLAKEFPTEEHALAYWVKARWPHGVRCLACDHGKCYPITTKGKTGKAARLYECASCGLHFSATTDTLFHDSHLPLQKWFMAIALMVEGKKGISAAQVARHIGVTYKTAWYLCHRIRQAMQEPAGFTVGGPQKTVEMDETYVGGRIRLQGVKKAKNAKATVLGLAERDGSIHMQVIPNGGLESLRTAVDGHLSPDTAKIVTDGKPIYRGVLPTAKHRSGFHRLELQKGTITCTYTVEGAFSLFKRGIVGNYHRLSVDHLNRYLGEFCWRYNRRKMQPWLFGMVLDNMAANHPLPYKTLTYQEPF